MIAHGWCRWYDRFFRWPRSSQINLQSFEWSAIFSTKRNKTNKTALKYIIKKEKTPTFGWSHVDDADDTRWYRSFRWIRLSQINLQSFLSSAIISTKRKKNQQNSFKIHNQKRENSNFGMIARRWCRWCQMIQIIQIERVTDRQTRQTDRQTDRLTSSDFGAPLRKRP